MSHPNLRFLLVFDPSVHVLFLQHGAGWWFEWLICVDLRVGLMSFPCRFHVISMSCSCRFQVMVISFSIFPLIFMSWKWDDDDLRTTWKWHGNDMETTWKRHQWLIRVLVWCRSHVVSMSFSCCFHFGFVSFPCRLLYLRNSLQRGWGFKPFHLKLSSLKKKNTDFSQN